MPTESLSRNEVAITVEVNGTVRAAMIERDSPNGPRITYSTDLQEDEHAVSLVEEFAIDNGFSIDWSSAIKFSHGCYRSPLVPA